MAINQAKSLLCGGDNLVSQTDNDTYVSDRL